MFQVKWGLTARVASGTVGVVPFRRVLVATDFSACSDRAAECGLRVAERFGAEVLFLHVFDVSNLPIISAYPYYYGQVNQQMVDDMQARAEAALEAFVKKHGQGRATVERKMVAGRPARQILEHGVAWRAELVVMGAHGIGKVRELLGSVVHAVVRQARCPVLTVPEPAEPEQPEQPEG